MILHQFLFDLKSFALMNIVILLTFNSRAPCRTLIGRRDGGVQRFPPLLSQFLLELEG